MDSVGGHKAFRDDFLVSVKDFGGGEREVMLRKVSTRTPTGAEAALMGSRTGSVGKKPPAADPGPWDEAFDVEAYRAWRDAVAERAARDLENRERAARLTRRECCARIKSIKADRMLTLTYRENMRDRSRLARDWKEFVRRLRRWNPGFQYVATHERQKRGAWHMHVAICGRMNYRLVRSIWRSVVGVDNGNVDVRNPFKERALRHKLAGYMSKYIAKNAHEGAKGERRMWCSEGIAIPRRETWGYACADWAEAMEIVTPLIDASRPLVMWHSRRYDLLFFASTNPC